MKVYKFGGASVKNAEGVKNIFKILQQHPTEGTMIVISAMGKTTNALEHILHLAISGENYGAAFKKVCDFHTNIVDELFPQPLPLLNLLEKVFSEIDQRLEHPYSHEKYDFYYDQLVAYGEYLSATILTHFLVSQGVEATFVDARRHIITDSTHRAAKVDMPNTLEAFKALATGESSIFVMQGFIGADAARSTTTLGREGSDYSAAIAAYCLDAHELIIWKDVDGVYNADPKIFSNTRLISKLSYREAVELAFYGASVIHPKTIRPLKEKAIPLRVRSFYHLDREGTIVKEIDGKQELAPSIIVKRNQLLLSLTPRDFSFMDTQIMSLTFRILSKYGYQINLLQNSAISFSICLDDDSPFFKDLLGELQEYFEVKYNRSHVLLSIRHYRSALIERLYAQLPLKIEQRSRSTYQIVMDEESFQNKAIDLLDKSGL